MKLPDYAESLVLACVDSPYWTADKMEEYLERHSPADPSALTHAYGVSICEIAYHALIREAIRRKRELGE